MFYEYNLVFKHYYCHLIATKISNKSVMKLVELYKIINSTLSELTQDMTEGRFYIYHCISTICGHTNTCDIILYHIKVFINKSTSIDGIYQIYWIHTYYDIDLII